MSEIVKTLGGDRLGSGNKNKTKLRNYERSTHDLSESFKSTAGVGMLIPCYCNLYTLGDTMEMKINAGVKTIPTRGPLFGSFKFQVDYFACPIRLYQGILHNNPLNIGLKMGQVKLPTIGMKQRYKLSNETLQQYADKVKFAANSLEKYLGISGIGVETTDAQDDDRTDTYSRQLQCVPELAYYDIFKNYYANKQEENAYVISNDMVIVPEYELQTLTGETADDTPTAVAEDNVITLEQTNEDIQDYVLEINTETKPNYKKILITFSNAVFYRTETLEQWIKSGIITIISSITQNDKWYITYKCEYNTGGYLKTIIKNNPEIIAEQTDLKLIPFKLENIDKKRYDILSHTQLGTAYNAIAISENEYLPYKVLTELTEDYVSKNTLPLNGILVKTYQSDLFNNWVQTEWIDGENGINAITSVQTNDGSFTIDALNLAGKVYNMLNRIAVSGGTYQDWLQAVYSEKVTAHCESPIYLGGMSSEITFDEVVSTAATEEDALGTLGGRGRLAGKKGGHIIFKCTEPTFVIGIMSITPRIDQTQGNAWYRTELKSVDDIHKPELDQIGFQDLLEEQMAAFAAKPDGDAPFAVGKVPAWINYMTSVDKAFGDFAETEGKAFMILARNYTMDAEAKIKDATTYIDPTKYNYAFAYTELQAQNFWVQIYHDVKARRKMSAKQIPNL